MEWTRSESLALAHQQCAYCHGYGLLLGRKSHQTPCNCVLRSVFRACYARFRRSVEKEKHLSRVTLHLMGGRSQRMSWGRKDEEYIADFTLVSKRHLDEKEYQIFKFHFLLGADWKLCCRRLGMDRGNFFHAVYRIQQKLGRAFRETQPYALFPLDEYFNGTSRRESEPAVSAPRPAHERSKRLYPVISRLDRAA
ncbi:MAG: hypothetical protein IT164_18930 [Bryobacterales bacterium]|nr:hypothetical protein [Bryobacterales bacterium]